MATCDTPGMATITPNIRLCRHNSMAVARGIVIVKPDEPFLVKLCNFGKDQVIVRKNSTLGFAEPYKGRCFPPFWMTTIQRMEPITHRTTRVVTHSRTPTSVRHPSTCTSRFVTCLIRLRLCGMEPLASSVLRSTPSSLLPTLFPYGPNPTAPGRSNGRSSLIRSTRC